MDQSILLWILGAGMTLGIAVMVRLYDRLGKVDDAGKKNSEQIVKHDGQIRVLEDGVKDWVSCKDVLVDVKLKANMFWDAIRPAVLKLIHEDTAFRRDALGDKFGADELTLEEAYEYDKLLEKNALTNHDQGKRLGSAILRGLVAIKIYELEKERQCQIQTSSSTFT